MSEMENYAQEREMKEAKETEEVRPALVEDEVEDTVPWDEAEEEQLPVKGTGSALTKPDKGGKSPGKKKTRRLTRKEKIIRLILAAVLLAVLAFLAWYFLGRGTDRRSRLAAAGAEGQRTAVVQRMSITSSLSSAGTLLPKNTYNITSLASGEVIQADFEEGDHVEEGQVLYVIDSSSMETEIHSAENSLTRAQESYQLAEEEYNDALADYSGNTYKATETGYIKALHVKAGDRVSNGTALADIYDDTVMKLRVPFLSTDAAMIGVGNEGVVTLSETGEQLGGVVKSVSNMEETLTGGRLVRYITMEVANPGGLTTSHSAMVQIGEWLCAQEGTFEPVQDVVMMANLSSNTSMEIESLLVSEGDYITEGSSLFRMTEKSAENLLRSYKNTMDSAQEGLESAQSRLESTQDTYKNYTITAPISGQVITKTSKVGDKMTTGGNNSTVMATIYDLSGLTFEMSVDELDVQKVQVGQKVEVHADAFEDETFTGTVTNISLASSYSNGVTNYPVTVTLDDTGSLLPGMNVDGDIILDEAEHVLTIPVDALMRGNRVYVKDASVSEGEDGAPAGFRAVQVETGLINDDYVEIVSGLEEGDEVYVSESSVSGNGFMMPGGMGGRGEMGGPGGGMGGAPGGGNRGGNMGGRP